MLRLGKVAMIAVLNDAGAVRSLIGRLISLQLRELMTRMAFANIHLKERPKFHSKSGGIYKDPNIPNAVFADGPYEISADFPETPPM